MSRRALRAFGLVAGLAVLALVGFAPGCKKQPESLIIVAMEANDANGGGVRAVQIIVNREPPSTAQVASVIFDLPSTGLPMGTTLEYGVYIPAGVTGSLPVTAIARPATGCAGYVGMRAAKVDGGDTTPVLIMMRPADVCTLAGTAGTGGTTGMGGRGGTTGTGGSTVTSCGTSVGTPPPPVAAPSLTNCVEVDHNPAGAVCDPSIDDWNPGILDVAVSPDGQLMATSGSDINFNGTVKIWRFQGNTPVPCGPVIEGLGIGPAFVAFSPDGQYLAVAWSGRYVEIYRVPGLAFVAEAQSSPNPLFGVGWSADSQAVFSIDWDIGGVDGTLYADRPDGSPITMTRLGVDPDQFAVAPVAVNGASVMAVAGYSGNAGVYTWNGSAFTSPMIVTTGPNAHGWGIRFSPNGRLLAIGASDGQVRFYNVPVTSAAPTGTAINVGSNNTVYGIAFAPAGDLVGLGFGMSAEIWNVTSRAFVARRLVTIPPGATRNFVYTVMFSASGGMFIAGEETCGKVLLCND